MMINLITINKRSVALSLRATGVRNIAEDIYKKQKNARQLAVMGGVPRQGPVSPGT